MTVSPGRMIAFLMMIAVTLAGTPNQIAANDGLNSSRYSIRAGTTGTNSVQSLVPRASSGLNPLRGQAVTASLSGDLQVATRRAAPSNFAAIVPLTDSMQIVPNQRGRRIASGQSQFAGHWNAWHQIVSRTASGTLSRLGSGLEWLDESAPAPRRIQASAAGYRSHSSKSRAVIRQIETSTPRVIQEIPAKPLKKLSGGNISVFMVDASQAPTDREIIEREIFDDAICMIGCEDDSRTCATRSACFGQDLLIDQFLPAAGEQGTRQVTKRPARLQVPAMTMGHRSLESRPEISGQSLIQTGKAVIRSIIDVVQPLALLERAVQIHQRIESAVIELDDLIWSAELYHVWNTCGMYE